MRRPLRGALAHTHDPTQVCVSATGHERLAAWRERNFRCGSEPLLLYEIAVASGVRILVVDDDDSIRETLRELLHHEGFAVTTAANGELAWSRLEANEAPDLILLDLMMPVLDGLGFRERQSRSVFAAIPVIIISANRWLDPELRAGGSLAGCAFVSKPFDIDRLLEEVERCLPARGG
jgi:CheY-like chemotaxis protein